MDSDEVHADAATYAGGRRCGCAGGEESWARALLRRGWDLSRKAPIAGVAATAAPVIGPPILILSIAGVALSVPFAACLASVAVSDRLMGALLPPAPPQPYYTYDIGFGDEESEQEELVGASGAPDQETQMFGYSSKTEEEAIVEQDESFASLPLSSAEPRLSEELVPLLAKEEGDSAEAEFADQKSAHELFVTKDGEHKDNHISMAVDNEYITMEAPSPGMVSTPEVPVFHEEENTVSTKEDAPVPAMKSVQELSVPDNENTTEDDKSTVTEETESSKVTPLPGLHTAESSDLPLPLLRADEVMVQRDVQGDVSGTKSGENSRVSDSDEGNKEQHKTTEVMVMPSNEDSVSESQGPDANTVLRNLEDEIAVKMALEEEMKDTNPVTGNGVDLQLDSISTTEPESESLQSGHRVAPELQAMTESANVHGTLGSNLTEGIAKDADNKSAKGVEHYGGEDVPSVVTVDGDKDLISSGSRLNVTAVSDGMTGVGSKTHADHPNKKTCVADKEHGKEKVVEDKFVETEESKTVVNKVSTKDMAAQDDSISEPLVPDDQSTREDEAIVEMVIEQVTTSIDPVTREVVDVQVDIIARQCESLPLSDLVAHELQEVTGAGTIDNETEDIVKRNVDTNVVDVEHQSGEGASSFVSVTSLLTQDDGEDLVSIIGTPYVSAISNDMTSVAVRPDLEHHHQTIGAEYTVMDREVDTAVLAEDKNIYTEEQLREQLNTVRTITGYRAVPSLTLEGELAGLYMFVGVEPPDSSRGASNLTELNNKLRFLKSIIGVE